MRTALEAAEVGVWDWNIVTGEVAWSGTLERIHGIAPGTFGGSFEAYVADIHPEDRDAVLGAIDAAVTTGGPFVTEYRIAMPDGTVRWVAGRGRVIADASGRPVRMTGSCQDVTRLRGAEESVSELRRELERLSVDLALAHEQLAADRARVEQQQKMELLGRLAAGVAHDFNNVLMIVTCSSELALAQVGPSDPARARLAEIRKAAARGAALTRRLLSFSRLSMPELRVVDVGAAVAAASAMLGRLVHDDVEIVCEADPGPNPVRIDAAQLDHILINLVVNARDAMPDGGRILVETRDLESADPLCCVGADLEPGRYVTLSVTDTGCGMDPATIGRVFDAFFTTKETGRGTGLGLSTVYGLVAEAGGGIQVASTAGLGTTFTVVLPRAEAEGGERDADAGPAREARRSVTLLYEPDAMLRALLREVLEAAGHEVVEARDRREVLDAYDAEPRAVDLVVADAPGLRISPRASVPTLLLTDDPAADGAGAEPDGNVVLVARPVDPDLLLRRAEEALARREDRWS
jgi:PAS domain S-box-containing protein